MKKKSSEENKRETIERGERSEAETSSPSEPSAQAGPSEQEEPGIPEELCIIPMRGVVLFPGVVLPVAIGRPRSLKALQEAVQKQEPIGFLLQRDMADDDPDPEDLYSVGCVAEILRYVTASDGTHHAIVQGRQRFRVVEFTASDPCFRARIELIEEPSEKDLSEEARARFIVLKEQAERLLPLMPKVPDELSAAIQTATSPAVFADMMTTFMDLPPEQKQEILETVDIVERLKKVSALLEEAIRTLELSQEIREKTQGKVDQAQREYLLREQLKTIQSELGEIEAAEIQELAKKIEEAGMPEEAAEEARKELKRLERLPESSAEYGMVRTYLDWLLSLPWSRSLEEPIDLKKARKILDEDHYGLEKVKKRILEFLAVRKLKPDGKGPILCLVGPPGVGKTSLGRSIARALGRKFVRISLGGVHDEAEIRGHRRTYIGAMPGNIIQSIRKAGSNDPVFMLDELDKLGVGFHGDPSAALLEVLDPEQNKEFRDHYLGVPFDLSKVFFIGTANVLDAIPGPLRDRCEVIQLPGYTREEKLQIARRYLVKRQLEANGVSAEQCQITDAALEEIVSGYTREAGCRNLEREIGAVIRHVAMRIALGEIKEARIDKDDLREILGPRRFENEVALRTSVPGVATGLAWTPVGGDILFVEATRMPGKGELILTGQLGDVMKESARAALTLVKAGATELGIDPEVFRSSDVHVHVPAGAIPKDGPSAGVAIYVALVSLFTNQKVNKDVAMTGEISLRGLVLPVGGIKEKVLAAHAAGIKTVLLPERNLHRDLEDIPEGVRKELRFVGLKTVDQALREALSFTLESTGAAGAG